MRRFPWFVVAIPLVLIGAVLLTPVGAQNCPFCGFDQYSQLVPIVVQPLPPTATPLPTATPMPSPTAAPKTVYVRSSRTINNSWGSLYVVGEVENNTGRPVYNVQVIARFYDRSDQLVATDNASAYLSRTAPGQRNPFRIIVLEPPSNIVRTSLEVTYRTAPGFLTYYPIGVLSQRVRDSYGWEVFGEVQNTAGRELSGVGVVVTFYDRLGNVVYADEGYATIDPLAPNAISTYNVSTTTNTSYATILVQAEGYD